jgi:ketosteroid isomerase-like protein
MSRESADAGEALKANAAFYEAFVSGDLSAMNDLWSTHEPVICVHPGGASLHGRIAVMASWQSLFENGPPPIRCSDERVVLVRGLAFISCLEHIGETILAATNTLVWEGGRWRLAFHQAGVIADPGLPTTGQPGPSDVLH